MAISKQRNGGMQLVVQVLMVQRVAVSLFVALTHLDIWCSLIRWKYLQSETSRFHDITFFQVDWLSYQNLPFDKVRDLRNQLNKNNPVWTGRDGQEIDSESGRDLLLSFNIIKDISEIRLKNIISISKQLKTDYLNK